MEAVSHSPNMVRYQARDTSCILVSRGCATFRKHKAVLIDGTATPEHASWVHPSQVPSDLMLIQAGDQKTPIPVRRGSFVYFMYH